MSRSEKPRASVDNRYWGWLAAFVMAAVLTVVLLAPVCSRSKFRRRLNAKYRAFVLALERSTVVETHGYYTKVLWISRGSQIVRVVAIPLDRSIVEAAIEYVSTSGRLSVDSTARLRSRCQQDYLDGDAMAVALAIYTAGLPTCSARLDDFSQHIRLRDETGDSYPVLRYTRVFDQPLRRGWTTGYVYFHNILDEPGVLSYSLHYEHLNMSSESGAKSGAFTFDNSPIDMLHLVERGLPDAKIRGDYGFESLADRGLDASGLMQLSGLVLTAIQTLTILLPK